MIYKINPEKKKEFESFNFKQAVSKISDTREIIE